MTIFNPTRFLHSTFDWQLCVLARHVILEQFQN